MNESWLAGLWTLLGATVGGVISFALNRQMLAHQLLLLREQFKSEYMAEEAARHYLNHASYTDRSFLELEQRLGGYCGDELRKLLVRAGAIRAIRSTDGAEMWRLLSRNDEAIARRQMARSLAPSADETD
jgi:hypothetical protein